MSKFQSGYDTTAARMFIVTKIKEELQRAFTMGLIKLNDEGIVVVEQGTHVDLAIPSFYHPVVFELSNKKYVAVDVRMTGKLDRDQAVFKVQQVDEYKSILMRGVLNKYWLDDSDNSLRNCSSLPLMLYANWMGEAISKRLALDPRDQFHVSILAAIFYMNLFSNDIEPNTDVKQLMISVISRELGFKSDAVFDVVQSFPVIKNLDEFCEACREYTKSVRLSQLNVATLTAIIGGYWYGSNGRELIAVAAEHPPTWLTLIYRAHVDRGFKKTGLTQILERPTYRRQIDQFVLQLAHLVRDR